MPVMATYKFPSSAVGLAVSVRVLVEAAGFSLNVALTPFGKPLAYKVTF